MDFPDITFLVRWLHVLSAIMWIGLLWYLNFVQTPQMAKIPDNLKPAISGHIAPAVLFWFRWAALGTIVFGLLLAHLNGYLHQAMALGWGMGSPELTLLGIGMWFGLIMAANVWFIIWPNQKKVLGLVKATKEAKAAAAKTAGMASRINTLLSIPMLFAMVAFQNSPF